MGGPEQDRIFIWQAGSGHGLSHGGRSHRGYARMARQNGYSRPDSSFCRQRGAAFARGYAPHDEHVLNGVKQIVGDGVASTDGLISGKCLCGRLICSRTTFSFSAGTGRFQFNTAAKP